MTSLMMRDPLPPPAPEAQMAEASGEFEIVLGKRQIAGVMFIASVLLAIFSAISYIAGEAMSPRKAAAIERPEPPPAVTPPPAPVLVEAPKAAAPPAPLFADPKNGELYLQMGAVDKGMATIFVEGLRAHGFEAFVAPGPSGKIFRVLIGPLADQDAYRRTKDAIDELGLNAFARKYEQ
jgi:cell division septation protein DedD